MSLRVAAYALAAVVSFGATASAQNLTLAVGAPVTSLDPHYHALSPNYAVADMLFDSLTTFDAKGKIIPRLADSWKPISSDVWEFKLHPGVKFHNGNDFTADDVSFTIDRVPAVPNSPSSYAVYTRGITRVEVIDPLTVHFHTNGPYPLLPSDLAQIEMLDRETHQGAATEDFNSLKVAIGTGPFRVVSYRNGDRIEYERNDNYFGEKPVWQRVTYRMITNDGARTAALLSGDVDFIDQVPTSDIAKLRNDSRVRMSEIAGLRLIYLYLDHLHDSSPLITSADGAPLPKNPLKDVRVRRALTLAIDRQAIVDRVMEGAAAPTGQFLSIGAFGSLPDLQAPRVNVEEAKRLLAEAGYPNGFRIVLNGPNDRYMNDARIIQAVGQMWTRIGVRTQVEAQPWAAFVARAARHEHAAGLSGWGISSGEATSPLRSLLATINPQLGWGGSNRGAYSNPAMDAKLAESLQTLDDAKREQLLREASQIAIDDVGIIPIHIQKNVWAMRPGLAHAARADELTRAQDITPVAQ
ncbi:ABC transporter substrate-binding protein [Roseomonas elaeocarpi]|uniref:ABC transporter substrate-binding protein n=1 Tax=Roseomonas elaeocarpi TaxID=907779 RepID=A0ABV6JQK8_9PROT